MEKRRARFQRVFIILLMIFLSGCAFASRKTFLQYTTVTPVKSANNITIEVPVFEDDRPNKDVIGNRKNVFGAETANIFSEVNVSEWITNALKSELENAGYKVVEIKAKNKIHGIVMNVYCNTIVNYNGEVSIKVSLKAKSDILFDKVYSGKSSDLSGVVVQSLKSYRNVLEKSLQDAMVQVVEDVDKALKK